MFIRGLPTAVSPPDPFTPPDGTWNLTGNLAIAGVASTGAPNPFLSVTGAAHTSLTASTEYKALNINLAQTYTWATGALSTQRFIYIGAPTIAFAGASTVTDAFTMYVSGHPAAGTNTTITRAFSAGFVGSLYVETSNTGNLGGFALWGHGSSSVSYIHITNSSTGKVTSGGGFTIGLNITTAYLLVRNAYDLNIGTAETVRWIVTGSGGHFTPNATTTYDIGTSSARVRALYAGSADLSTTLTLNETTGPAGVTNTAQLFAQDNGAGKTQLMVQFASGAAIQLAIQA